MIHQIDINGNDMVDKAILRLKTYEPEEGYWLAFSGGKDSCVIKALADMAGVKYTAHYSVTGIDPPELCYFIKEHHPDVIWDIPKDKDGNRITMWSLIPKKKMPPTRLARYCCEALKESQGKGKLTITGVRWAESKNRKDNQGGIVVNYRNAQRLFKDEDPDNYTITSKGGAVLQLDNSETRRMVEMCYKTHRTTLNPIIDWTDEDVWEFLKEYNIPYCCLYDQGFKRLGCVGCPMSYRQESELERYPRYKALYLKAFQNMIDKRNEAGLETKWETPEEVLEWWTSDKRSGKAGKGRKKKDK